MTALFESNYPGREGSNYEGSTVSIYLANGTDDGQPVGIDIAAFHTGGGVVVPDADIPRLIAALNGYLASRGQPSAAGWVVLTNDVKDGPPKWQPGWDGELHTGKDRADAELADCRAGGHQCVLGEVRVTE